MSLVLNGVDLEQPGKWWSFVNDWPHLHGWCHYDYRAELVEAVTGVTHAWWPSGAGRGSGHTVEYYGNEQDGPQLDLSGGSAVPAVQRPGHSGSLLMHGFPFRGTPLPTTGVSPSGSIATIPAEYHYRLVDNSTLYLAVWASLRWGMLADGDNRFDFSFDGAADWGAITIYEHWTWELEEGETWSGVTWDQEYTLEPIVHSHLDSTTDAPYMSTSQSVNTGPYGVGANGTAYCHGVNHDNGVVIAWEPGMSGTWDFWVHRFNETIYWSLYFVDDAETPVTDGTFLDVAGGALPDAWVNFTATIPTAPAGTTGLKLVGRTDSGGGGIQATYYVDEVTVTSVGP